MDFSKIIVQPIVSIPFQENAYIAHLRDSAQVVVVDPGMEPDKIIEFLQQHSLEPIAILITHGHYDHIGGVMTMVETYPNCKVYIGEHEKDKPGDPHQNLSAKFELPIAVRDADILLKDGEVLELAGLKIQVHFTPGHSAGHVIYQVEAEPKSLIFVGDVIFQESIGRSDFEDGNGVELIQSIRSKILTQPDDTVLYSGHGMPTTVGHERKYNPFLR